MSKVAQRWPQAAMAMRITGQRSTDLPLEYLFDRAPMAIAITAGPEHEFRAVNRAFAVLFGDRGGWVGKRLREVVDGSEAAVLPWADAIYRSGTTIRREDVLVRGGSRDGTSDDRAVTLTVQPTRDASGATTGLIFFGLDVTAEVELRRRLQAADAAQRALVDQLPSGIEVVVLDHTGRPVIATGLVREMLGGGGDIDRETPLARHAARFDMRWADTGEPIDPSDSPSTRALSGQSVVAEVIGRPAPGAPRQRLRVSARPIPGEGGATAGAVMIFELMGSSDGA